MLFLQAYAAERLFERSQARRDRPCSWCARCRPRSPRRTNSARMACARWPVCKSVDCFTRRSRSMHVRRGDDPADAQSRKRNFRKAVDLNDDFERSSCFSDGTRSPRGAQPRINVIFDHRDLKARGNLQQTAAFGNRQRRPGRIVEVRREDHHLHAILHEHRFERARSSPA